MSSFSQTDTTKVRIKVPVAKLAVKDIIKGDGCFEELKLTREKLIKLQEREAQKDTIIKLYSEKDENSQYIIHQYELQVGQYEHMTSDLQDEIKKERTKTFLYKVGTLIGILTTSYLLIVK